MLIEEIHSVYEARIRGTLGCKTIKIREDLYAKLLQEIAKDIVHCSTSEPNKIFGMEIKPVSTNEDYRFIILD